MFANWSRYIRKYLHGVLNHKVVSGRHREVISEHTSWAWYEKLFTYVKWQRR